MSRVTIHHDNIKRMVEEMQESFDRNGPIRVSVEADVSGGLGTAVAPTTINNFYGDKAQVAYGNQNVTQTQLSEPSSVPATTALADALVKVLELLPHAGLSEDDQEDVAATGRELLAEIDQPVSDPKKVKRAFMAVKGYFTPLALSLTAGAASGTASGAELAARAAIETLLNVQL